jgi:hypothetical protein
MKPTALATRRAANRRWLAFFVVLGLLSAVAVVLPIVYNLRQQLRPEQLEAARQRWREQGPSSYDLEYTVQLGRDPRPERHVVLVRDGRVVLAACDGELTRLDPVVGFAGGAVGQAAVLVADGPAPRDVGAIFAHIESVLRSDPEAGRRNLAAATFDPADGHPRRFIHRVRGTSEREEWTFRLRPAGAIEASGGR